MRRIRFYGEILVSQRQFHEMKERIEQHLITALHSVMGKEKPHLAEKISVVVKNIADIPLKIKVSTTEAQEFERAERLERKQIA